MSEVTVSAIDEFCMCFQLAYLKLQQMNAVAELAKQAFEACRSRKPKQQCGKRMLCLEIEILIQKVIPLNT